MSASTDQKDDSLVALLMGFFPGKGEISAFVGGLVLGGAILVVLAGIAWSIGGFDGITTPVLGPAPEPVVAAPAH